MRIASSNPAIARVAANATTPGTAFVDVFVPDGSSDASFYVQGAALGPVNITASQAQFATGTLARDVVQPVLQIAGLSPSQTSLSPDNEFYAYPGIPGDWAEPGGERGGFAVGDVHERHARGGPAGDVVLLGRVGGGADSGRRL